MAPATTSSCQRWGPAQAAVRGESRGGCPWGLGWGGSGGAQCRTGGSCWCRCGCHAAAGGLLSSTRSPRGLQRSVPNPASPRFVAGGGRDPGGVAPPGRPAGSPRCAGLPATGAATRAGVGGGGHHTPQPPAWRCHRAGRGGPWGRTCGSGRVCVRAGARLRRARGSGVPSAVTHWGHAGGCGAGRGAPADLRADQAAAGGDRHSGVLQPRHRHGRGVPACAPLDLPPHRWGVRVSGDGMGGGIHPTPRPSAGCPLPHPPFQPLHPSCPPLCLAGTWRSASWRSWPPPGPQHTPLPPAACRTSPSRPHQGARPGPGRPPPAAPQDNPRGRGAEDLRAGPHGVRPVPRCRGAGWAPPATRPTCNGCRRPTLTAGGRPPTSHPPPMTLPTAPCSSGPPGDRTAPRWHPRAAGLCRGAGATRCPGRPLRPGTGGPVGYSCPRGAPAPPGTARRCPGQLPAGNGSWDVAGGDGGRGATSSLMPPVWWSGPSMSLPHSGSRSATPGGPRGPPPPQTPPLRAPGLPHPQQHPRPPGSTPEAPAVPGRARLAVGVPGGGPPRGVRRCMPRPCVRPCPASGGTRRPTPTRKRRGARGGPGGGTAATPTPTAAAAAAWRAPGPPRGPPAPPEPEERGLAGCGTLGVGLGEVWSQWGGARQGVALGRRGLVLRSPWADPNKAVASQCAASASCVRAR